MTPEELVEKMRALSEEDRARVVQLVLATFPELDRDGMTDLERERLDAELDESHRQADRGETVPLEELFDKRK